MAARSRRRHLAAALGVALSAALALGACSSGGGSSSPDSSASSASTTAGGSTGAATAVTLPGVAAVELSNPPAGNGERPELSWQALSGAARYQVVVRLGDGVAWSWSGAETAVPLGGVPGTAIDPGLDGPTLTGTSTWSVIAYGPDGRVLASTTGAPLAA